MFLDTSPQMIAKSSADRQAFIILFRSEVRKFARWQACRSGTGQVKEDHMRKLSIAAGIAAMTMSTAVAAHDTTTAYPSRGACEAASAAMSNDENAWLVATFPQFFDTTGEAASFLTRAFTCDRNESDGLYYITDHIADVLGSDWFAQRNH